LRICWSIIAQTGIFAKAIVLEKVQSKVGKATKIYRKEITARQALEQICPGEWSMVKRVGG
jgi:hypothetical protein